MRTTACSIAFTDVHSADYYYDGTVWLYCHQAISGYNDNTFRPFNNTTRGQMVKIVALAYNLPAYHPVTPTFNDVPPTQTFYQYIENAAHSNVVSGYNYNAEPQRVATEPPGETTISTSLPTSAQSPQIN